MHGSGEVADHGWVFVSPHLDDVILSCGGTVARAARVGRPTIVTVFAGIPEGEMNEFARYQHDRWRLDHENAVASRREEDHRAAKCIGESVEVKWLDYLDAIYRDPGYASDDAIFGQILPGDLLLAEQIYNDLSSMGSQCFVIPMGSGNHVDHQIVREAGLMLLADGNEVWGYVEIPYALDSDRRHAAIQNTDFDEVARIPLDDDAMRRKLKAVSQYASQLPVLFRDRGHPDVELTGFARELGNGRAIEMLWRLRRDSVAELDLKSFNA